MKVRYKHSKADGTGTKSGNKTYTSASAVTKAGTESAILADLQKKHKDRQIVITEIIK